MSKINKEISVKAFAELGRQLSKPDAELQNLINTEHLYNPWFTASNVENAVKAIAEMLNRNHLELWLNNYPGLDTVRPQKKVGLILAGNIPLVGFHDVLCVLITGNVAIIKASGNDARLIKHVLQMLVAIEPGFAHRFTFTEKLTGYDAVIATGSNNTSRYFEFYFGKVPHIIRKNRNSVALLTGTETTDQLHALGGDIFDYFGLGCRNVSKLLVPQGYDFTAFFEAIEDYNTIINHYKYHNNYDYNKSIYLVNRDKHLDNGFLLVKEDASLSSALAVLHYETYSTLNDAAQKLASQSDNIQCVVAQAEVEIPGQTIAFGGTQMPNLWDYADGVDTMNFLSEL